MQFSQKTQSTCIQPVQKLREEMNDITSMLWKSPRQNTLKIPINFECDSLKQKSHNGTTNKQQNKTNKQRIILPFQTGKIRFVPNLLRAKKCKL